MLKVKYCIRLNLSRFPGRKTSSVRPLAALALSAHNRVTQMMTPCRPHNVIDPQTDCTSSIWPGHLECQLAGCHYPSINLPPVATLYVESGLLRSPETRPVAVVLGMIFHRVWPARPVVHHGHQLDSDTRLNLMVLTYFQSDTSTSRYCMDGVFTHPMPNKSVQQVGWAGVGDYPQSIHRLPTWFMRVCVCARDGWRLIVVITKSGRGSKLMNRSSCSKHTIMRAVVTAYASQTWGPCSKGTTFNHTLTRMNQLSHLFVISLIDRAYAPSHLVRREGQVALSRATNFRFSAPCDQPRKYDV